MSPEALQRKLFYADIQGERCLDQFGEVLERCEGQVAKMEDGGTVPWENVPIRELRGTRCAATGV